MRFRQVHLDFHTSEHIPNVGAKFDPKEFADVLKSANVDSVTCFSKCHHGWSYHNTSIGKRHPNLKCELLPLQIEACHSADIRVPIYISVGIDDLAAREHPEWLYRAGSQNFSDFTVGYKLMCLQTDYLDYVIAQTEEVCRNYDGDGLFFDIIHHGPCDCQKCIDTMLAKGINPENLSEVMNFRRQVTMNYYHAVNRAVKAIRPDWPIFHNSGNINRNARETHDVNTHLELESLPTGLWGYDHFPVAARFAQTVGKQYLGMTGKFHTTWGEFGGYKRKKALNYEVAAMLANGAKCSIGDQLHPDGHIDSDTYKLIGSAYQLVRDAQLWCDNVTSVADIGILDTMANPNIGILADEKAIEGAARMCLEKHYLFDVLDSESDFSKYKMLILPDTMTLSPLHSKKLGDYVNSGGSLILSGYSGMNTEQNKFALDFDCEVVGKSEFSPDYLIADKLGDDEIPSSPMVMYETAWKVKPKNGEVLSKIAEPYFNRTWRNFCSHQHTPPEKVSQFPAAIQKGRIIWFAHPVFTAYRLKGQSLLRDAVANAITRLLPSPSVKALLPSTGRVSLMEQLKEKRYILHLLFCSPVQRGENIGVIEDTVPLYDVPCVLRLEKQICKVYLAPQMQELPFKRDGNTIEVVIPKVESNQMVVFETV